MEELEELATNDEKFQKNQKMLLVAIQTSILYKVTNNMDMTVQRVFQNGPDLEGLLKLLIRRSGIPEAKGAAAMAKVKQLGHYKLDLFNPLIQQPPMPAVIQNQPPPPGAAVGNSGAAVGNGGATVSTLTQTDDEGGVPANKVPTILRQGSTHNLSGFAAAASRGDAEGGSDTGRGRGSRLAFSIFSLREYIYIYMLEKLD